MEARLRKREAEAKEADFRGAREAEALRPAPNANGWSQSNNTEDEATQRLRKSLVDMGGGPLGGGGPSWNEPTARGESKFGESKHADSVEPREAPASSTSTSAYAADEDKEVSEEDDEFKEMSQEMDMEEQVRP